MRNLSCGSLRQHVAHTWIGFDGGQTSLLPTYRCPGVLGKDDDMSKFEFSVSEGEELTIEGALGQLVGFASVAWSEGTRGVFLSDKVSEAMGKFLELLQERMGQG